MKSSFVIGEATSVTGGIDLTAAQANDLVDNQVEWSKTCEGLLNLNGFTYKRIHGPTDARTRLAWLAKADEGKDKFYPQPYKQLAKVLHDMGHEHDAREVSYVLAEKLETERLRRIREDRKEVIRDAAQPGKAIGLSLYLGSLRIWKFLFGLLVGYGWRPFRSLSALVLLIFVFWLPTIAAWHFGDFAPNSGVVLQGQDWIKVSGHDNAANEWSGSITGRDWESFHSLTWAADVVIPIIEFGQTDAWAPSTERGAWGALLWWLRWPFTLAGWIVTALGAAALTGVIRRE